MIWAPTPPGGADGRRLRHERPNAGSSSRGPSIAGMYQYKPDLVAYTHFLGSKTVGMNVPDTGIPAACPVAAGVLRLCALSPNRQWCRPATMFQKLKNTAYKPGGGGGTPGARTSGVMELFAPVDAYNLILLVIFNLSKANEAPRLHQAGWRYAAFIGRLGARPDFRRGPCASSSAFLPGARQTLLRVS